MHRLLFIVFLTTLFLFNNTFCCCCLALKTFNGVVLFASKTKRKKVRSKTTHTIIRWWHFRVIRRWCQYCRGLDLWVHYIQITHTVELVCDICAVSFALNALILLFFICGAFYDTIYIHVQRIHILRSIHSDNMFGALKFNYKQWLWERYATNVRQRNMVMYFTMDSNAASNGINGTHKWWWQCVRSCSIGAWFDMNVLCFVTQANF